MDEKYWIVGASREGVSRTDEFTGGGFWELAQEGRMNPRNQATFLQMRVNDRIAIKALNGTAKGNKTSREHEGNQRVSGPHRSPRIFQAEWGCHLGSPAA